jgi:hypothetical protein
MFQPSNCHRQLGTTASTYSVHNTGDIKNLLANVQLAI